MSGRLNTVLKTLPAKKNVRAHVLLAGPASGALTSAGGLQRAAGLSLIFLVQKDRSLRRIQPMKCGVMQITQAVGAGCKVFDDIPALKYSACSFLALCSIARTSEFCWHS